MPRRDPLAVGESWGYRHGAEAWRCHPQRGPLQYRCHQPSRDFDDLLALFACFLRDVTSTNATKRWCSHRWWIIMDSQISSLHANALGDWSDALSRVISVSVCYDYTVPHAQLLQKTGLDGPIVWITEDAEVACCSIGKTSVEIVTIDAKGDLVCSCEGAGLILSST